MHCITSLLVASVAFAAAAREAQGAPLNKCVVDGTVTYQQRPCPSPSTQAHKDPTLAELNAAEKLRRAAAASAPSATPRMAAPAPAVVLGGFRCDGRQYCTQMRSCEEAKYFLANCPGVKMDGDRDSVPCEQQWCSR